MTASFDGLHRAATQSQTAAIRTPLRRQHRFEDPSRDRFE